MKYSSLNAAFRKKEGYVREKQGVFLNFLRQLLMIQSLTGILLMKFHLFLLFFPRRAEKQYLIDRISAVAVEN